MGRLNGTTTYLIGPIDHVDDDGVGWRSSLSPKLQAMGITVFDPTSKPCDIGQEIGPEKDRVMKLKADGDWNGLRQYMKEIVHVDLRMTQKSDFVIACMPGDTKMCGTIHEIVLAVQCKIPVMLYCPDGMRTVSNWMFGIIHYNDMYETEDALMAHLDNVDNGITTVDSRKWQMFDWSLLEETR